MPFMTLSLETRLKAYSNLLSPDPKHHNAYHNLPHNTSNLRPSILRISRKVYLEASSVLYTSNILALDITHLDGNAQFVNGTHWCQTAKERLLWTKGAIYPQGLRHMRRAEIRVDERALSISRGPRGMRGAEMVG